MFSTLITIVGYLLIALGVFISVSNWMLVITKAEGTSVTLTPFVGSILLAVGIYLIFSSFWLALIAIPADLGTTAIILGLIWLAIKRLAGNSNNDAN